MTALNTDVDSVTLSLIRGALFSAARELGSLIERTSMSPSINEKHDFCVGFTDRGGLFHTEARSTQLAGTNLVRLITKHYPVEDMRSGDLYWYNDCYASEGVLSHSPDMAFVSPAFSGDTLLGFCASFGHFWDIGGARPGSLSPNATEVFQEGIIVPAVRIVRAGEWNDELFRTFVRNSRFPDMLRGDIRALTAAARLGEDRLREIAERFGTGTLLRATELLIDDTAKKLSDRLRDLVSDEPVRFAQVIDSDGVSDREYWVRLTLFKKGERIELDATGTDAQAPGPINYLMDRSVPMLYLANNLVRDDPGVHLNGAVSTLVDDVIVPPGSILSPRFPAPLSQRSLNVKALQSAVQGLVARLSGGRSPASSATYALYMLRAVDKTSGKPILCTEGIAVGFGAHPDGDGPDAIYSHSQKNFPCEYMEMRFPVRLDRYEIHRDSGGPGRHRGGCGVVREFTFLGENGELAPRLGNTVLPPWGVAGGHAGRPGSVTINPDTPRERRLKPLSDGNRIEHGDRIRIVTSGGGGWGHPFDREVTLVRRDVLNGFVSIEKALEDYGVVLMPDGVTVDVDATDRHRSATREDAKQFHHGEYVNEIW